MAFMGRGDRPSIGDNDTSNCQHGGPFLYICQNIMRFLRKNTLFAHL